MKEENESMKVFIILAVFFDFGVVAIVNPANAQDSAALNDSKKTEQRSWRDSTSEFSTEARFVSLIKGVVTIAQHDDKEVGVPLDRLCREDQKYMMDLTGWGRVWLDANGSSFIADLVSASDNSVTFEFTDGSRNTKRVESLDRRDQDYVRNRRAALIANQRRFVGEVVGVTDGDTIAVLVDRQQVKVRLVGIDAPERGQAFGTAARSALAALCMRKQVLLRAMEPTSTAGH